MKSIKNKKVLCIIGMERKLEQSICETAGIQPENILVLKSVHSDISQPYGELMRDIITLVYQEKVDEILIVRSNNEQVINEAVVYNLRSKDLILNERMNTLNYLFQSCNPEFPSRNINEWLAGSKTSTEGIQKSVSLIRRHPLIPSHVKVCGFLLDTDHAILTEIDVT
ncbi:carbonic anhydrase [Bacillus changyiensis]|uniref:carbonic anhydrase n=1 Tax=Bacillus changyiensis TaxID=3004103 RepID=UPI0022E77741|nr:carbonic anhydrase [Bacillus changyiensis]MDA1477241.1 carbonic anhydrase [Bacillus changyiensis]